MRGTLLSRQYTNNNNNVQRSPSPIDTPRHPSPIPTIRLVTATPSSTDLNTSIQLPNQSQVDWSVDSSWAVPSPIAPKILTSEPQSRKRVVPKKSKLGLLGGKERKIDFSDVVRRVGADGSSAGRGGYDIYVDQTDDPDIGEILVVRKKKSRAGLDGLEWGPLGEVTNVPKEKEKKEGLLKVKGEENKDKWWTIGRGRKDSKEKTKDKENANVKPRAKSPGLPKHAEARARFNSLDSGVLLSPAIPIHVQTGPTPVQPKSDAPPRSETPGLLAPPGLIPSKEKGSVAIRAMRSVRSLARIGSWAQLKNGSEEPVSVAPPKSKSKSKNKDDTVKAKSSKKSKSKSKETETIRNSGSSFEAGQLSTSPEAVVQAQVQMGKKQSILGLNLPGFSGGGTMRLPSSRSGSGASSLAGYGAPVSGGSARLALHPAIVLNGGGGRDRLASMMSMTTATSSLRPLSSCSGESESARSSRSVRWDEEGLENGKVRRSLERERDVRSRKEGSERDATDKGSERSKKKSSRSKDKETGKDSVRSKESRRHSDGRKRTPLTAVFPVSALAIPTEQAPASPPTAYYAGNPVVTVQEATIDEHEVDLDERENEDGELTRTSTLETPVKKARPRQRPVSEQLLGKSRPQGMYEEESGVMSVLDAATNDLAQLINHLDLEATPGTPDRSPAAPILTSADKETMRLAAREFAALGDNSVRQRVLALESPVKKQSGLRNGNAASITSLRAYAQSRTREQKTAAASDASQANLIGQQIAPWPTLDWTTSSPTSPPVKSATPPASASASSTFMTHKRTLTPAPAADPPPVFQPLRPAKKTVQHLAPVKVSPSSSFSSPVATPPGHALRTPSSLTFGSHSVSSSISKVDVKAENSSTPTPGHVFRKAQGHERKRSVLAPAELQQNNQGYMALETKRALGLSGTMGSSTASVYARAVLDADLNADNDAYVCDRDSDIPEELQLILAGHPGDDGAESLRSVEDTLSYRPECTDGSPVSLSMSGPTIIPLRSIATATATTISSPGPTQDVPVFRASVIDEDENHADVDEGTTSSEDDTKKSFDFTGELQKLNQSGASDRRSFVEQLENAFRTPAKIDLRYGFGDSLGVEIPPVPKAPTLPVEAVTKEKHIPNEFISQNDSLPIDTHRLEPTLLPGSDSLAASEDSGEMFFPEPYRGLKTSTSVGSRPSDGELNKDFKFGGRHSPPQLAKPEDKQLLTLSDIIPPPSRVRAMSTGSIIEDDSVLRSIFAKASEIPAASRMRLNSDSSSKRQARDISGVSQESNGHARQSSSVSFAGFDSFAEIRRGFEFGQDRPAFYPPPAATRRRHGKQESMFSIASVSSYGRVINPGSTDPFDFGDSKLPDIPQSDDDYSISMSMSVDDTFSFIHRDSRDPRRRRVDSDASSFYFRAPAHSHMMQPYNRAHRRHDSAFSIASIAPPVSLHNRSFAVHRRNDSNTSASSMAFSYAMHGANSGRAAWARHRQDASVDSVNSDFSARHRLGRPGLGDKMLESALDYGMPLTSILASPPDSTTANHYGNRTSYDSILDDEGRRSSTDYEDRKSSSDDSLFDKTGHRSSASSESVFGYDDAHPPQGDLLLSNQFRPLSMFSSASVHSANREDDTMISMLGGGHVRRRSVASVIDASPCVRVEKKKQSTFDKLQQRKAGTNTFRDSPNEACIVEKPSIASTTSYKFGGERMIRAQKGLYERQSLEDSCLVADGEDLSASLHLQPVFSRPGPATRSRSSTCTSSSGADTPPLSAEESSSQSDGSQSSIDLSHVSVILSNATHPVTGTARDRVRARARGEGHRRRISQARASRSSVYETIEEEMSSASSAPASPQSVLSEKNGAHELLNNSSVFIVDPENASADSVSMWDDESGITALRKYYTLREEAQDTVVDSKRVWLDTPFSLYAIQSFNPPRHPAGMQALLQHSIENYGPLPPDLRRIRSRTQSRPSPYPQNRSIKTPISSDQTRSSITDTARSFSSLKTPGQTSVAALQQVSINPNIISPVPPSPLPDAAKKLNSPFVPQFDNSELVKTFGLPPAPRPRVPSNARRSALGWSKRSTGKSSNKENNISQGLIMTPSDSLRLNRPRPRGRPTPGSARPIRA